MAWGRGGIALAGNSEEEQEEEDSAEQVCSAAGREIGSYRVF